MNTFEKLQAKFENLRIEFENHNCNTKLALLDELEEQILINYYYDDPIIVKLYGKYSSKLRRCIIHQLGYVILNNKLTCQTDETGKNFYTFKIKERVKRKSKK